MAGRVVSVLRTAPLFGRGMDPVLEANAYAVAEAVDIALVLTGPAVELALAGGVVPPRSVGGVALPPAAHDQDLLGLLESGVAVYVFAPDLTRLGLSGRDVVPGVRLADAETFAAVLREAEAVLCW